MGLIDRPGGTRNVVGMAFDLWAVLVLAASTLAAPTLSGQAPSAAAGWQVVSAHFAADLRAGDGGAEVVVTYVLRPRSAGPLPLDVPIDMELLGFGEATASSVMVDGEFRVLLWETVGSHRAASILAPANARGDTLAMRLAYRIEHAVDDVDGALHARIPVLAGPSAPIQGGAGFQARLVLPDAWRPDESFPAGLRRNDDGSYTVSLPVVPAMVGFRGRSDGAWRLGLPVVVDILIVTILVIFSAVGWRHLRRVAQEARA